MNFLFFGCFLFLLFFCRDSQQFKKPFDWPIRGKERGRAHGTEDGGGLQVFSGEIPNPKDGNGSPFGLSNGFEDVNGNKGNQIHGQKDHQMRTGGGGNLAGKEEGVKVGDGSATDGKTQSPEDNLFESIAEKLNSSLVPDGEEPEEEEEVCYPVVGCFAMGKPWKSLLRPVFSPFSPERMQSHLLFYSRSNLNSPIRIDFHPELKTNGARFDPKKSTVFVVHGFCSSANSNWMKEMKNAYLKKLDGNVFLVDWERGSNLLNYLQAAGNTRLVGRQLAMFVNHLRENHKIDPGRIHLIGHSLGAQICSYLAKEVPGIGRLTALDPAQPAFEGFDKMVRLDREDARFVDVIHTSSKPFLPSLGFGMMAPHGHVDFYMNGGFNQPGCVRLPREEFPSVSSLSDLAKFPVELISKLITCPHSRSYEFLIEAFNETEKCVFWGHKADAANVLKAVTNTVTQGAFQMEISSSSACNEENCIPMGFRTEEFDPRGSFVVMTSSEPPYCIPEPGIPNPEAKPFTGTKNESFIQRISKKITSGW